MSKNERLEKFEKLSQNRVNVILEKFKLYKYKII